MSVFLEGEGVDLWLLKNIKEIIFILLKKKDCMTTNITKITGVQQSRTV